MRFGSTLNNLIKKEHKKNDEVNFVEHYYLKMPVNTYPSLMNKICYAVEKETEGISKQNSVEFDYTILKNTNIEYTKLNYDKIKEIHNHYKKETQRYFSEVNNEDRHDGLTKSDARKMFVQRFKAKAEKSCSNKDELCNIVLDLCYTTNESKQFAWDVCGDTIIKNLLVKNNYKIKYPELNKNGEIEFGGLRFSMKEATIDKEEIE